MIGPSPCPAGPWHTAQTFSNTCLPRARSAGAGSSGLTSSRPARSASAFPGPYGNAAPADGTVPSGGSSSVWPVRVTGFAS